MSERPQPAHIVDPPIAEAEEIEVDRSKFGPGIVRFEIDFDREEFERLRAGYTRGPEGYTRFIKRAALELADREAKRKTGDRLRGSA